jgi:hypothetical protein
MLMCSNSEQRPEMEIEPPGLNMDRVQVPAATGSSDHSLRSLLYVDASTEMFCRCDVTRNLRVPFISSQEAECVLLNKIGTNYYYYS